MKIKVSLLRVMTRQCLPATLIALPVGGFYVLLRHEPLNWADPWMGLFVLAHSIAVVVCLGRYRSPAFAFLYTRGLFEGRIVDQQDRWRRPWPSWRYGCRWR